MINAIGIALSGMAAASQRIAVGASNIANALTVGRLSGDPAPYTPLDVVSRAQGETGGVLTNVTARNNPYAPAYMPNSPFADENGVVGAPNVDYAQEIVNMKLAEISYKANIKTIKVQSDMMGELLKTFDKKV